MKCPTDGTVLHVSERQGVELDYCPTCRGVWLDRGELDKLIERVAASTPYDDRDDDGRYDDDRDDGRRSRPGDPRRRKRSFLGELFEFGD